MSGKCLGLTCMVGSMQRHYRLVVRTGNLGARTPGFSLLPPSLFRLLSRQEAGLQELQGHPRLEKEGSRRAYYREFRKVSVSHLEGKPPYPPLPGAQWGRTAEGRL